MCEFNILELNPRKEEDQEKLFLLCKEGLSKDSREDYYEKMQCLNRFVIGGFILSEPVINIIRRELRKFAEGLKVDNEEIEKIIRQEVLKREILEGDDASKTQAKIRRFYKKQLKEKENTCAERTLQNVESTPQNDSQIISTAAYVPEDK